MNGLQYVNSQYGNMGFVFGYSQFRNRTVMVDVYNHSGDGRNIDPSSSTPLRTSATVTAISEYLLENINER